MLQMKSMDFQYKILFPTTYSSIELIDYYVYNIS